MTKYIVSLRLLEQEVRLWLFRYMRHKNCPSQEIAVICRFGSSVSPSSMSYIYLAIALFTLL